MLHILRLGISVSLKDFLCPSVDIGPLLSAEHLLCEPRVWHPYDVSVPAELFLENHYLNTDGVRQSQNTNAPVMRAFSDGIRDDFLEISSALGMLSKSRPHAAM